MPDFSLGEWLNIPSPLTRLQLQGRVILIDFWEYTCINCIRTLPYLKAWYERYRQHGLEIIGIHTPEFSFGRSRSQVEEAIHAEGIAYPVLLDNEYANWLAFANRAWPTKYLMDTKGYIRYRHQGEGNYQEIEQALQALLLESDPTLNLPPVMPLQRPEDRPGAVCYPPTPEIYGGYERGSLGNQQGYAPDTPIIYELPRAFDHTDHYFYAGGIWRAGPESFAFAGQDFGQISLTYQALRVNAVLSPSDDLVTLMLKLHRGDTLPRIDLLQDGIPLAATSAGRDVHFDPDGSSYVLVETARMYELVHNPTFEGHHLELIFRANGLALYSFTFTTCIDLAAGQQE